MKTKKQIEQEHFLQGKIAAYLKEGQEVFYHSIIGDEHDGVIRKIESKPWKLGHGAWVVKVSDISGGVCVTALTPLQSAV